MQITISKGPTGPGAVEIIALVVSILAALISAYAVWIQKKDSRTSLQVPFYEEHFKKALQSQIPDARNKIKIVNGELQNIDELQTVLSDMRINADFFRYASPTFYKEFRTQNQRVEDYLVSGLNQRYDHVGAREFEDKCDKELGTLYQIICKQYFGL